MKLPYFMFSSAPGQVTLCLETAHHKGFSNKISETTCQRKITQAPNEKQNILNKSKAKEDKKPP